LRSGPDTIRVDLHTREALAMGDARQELAAAIEAALRGGDIGSMTTALLEYATDDFATEWPQSGERLNRDTVQRMAEYPQMSGTNPRFTYQGMHGGGDLFVVEGTIDYGDGVPVRYVGIGELRGDKVAKMTEYFANPFEAPEWRRGMTEQIAPATA
jgi:hypothetical protein